MFLSNIFYFSNYLLTRVTNPQHQNMNVQCEYYFKISYAGSKSNMEHVKTNILVRPIYFVQVDVMNLIIHIIIQPEYQVFEPEKRISYARIILYFKIKLKYK